MASAPRRGQPRFCKRRSDGSDGSTVPMVHRDAVFAIPELLSLVTTYLDKSDLLSLIRVCRAWNALWVSYLYSTLSLCKYKRSRVYFSLEIYGYHVKALTVHSTQGNNILHLLDYTPNITFLEIQRCPISSAQLQGILGMVRRLRTFNVLFGEENGKSHDCPLILASMLPDLEELSWKGKCFLHYGGYSKVCIEDILHMLKSCTKLRSLRLANVVNPETELPDLESALSNEDEGWQSRSLRLLECDNTLLGLRPPYEGVAKDSWIRRLFQHAPNLRTFKYTGLSNFYFDWTGVFESAVNLENLELWSEDGFFNSVIGGTSHTTDAIAALAASNSNLKAFNTQYAHSTTDQLFAPFIRSNRQLQRLCVKGTGFGDTSLKELVRTPSVLPAIFSAVDNLVRLNMESCHLVTSAGVLPILENCRVLKDLNLAGTSAGTLELFNRSRPWACAKSLHTLQIDIQPIGFQAPPLYGARRLEAIIPTPSTVLYTLQEQLIIRERLRSLAFLTDLDLRGGAMDFEIFDEASFAPRLQMINIIVPCRDQQDPSPSSRFSLMRERVEEIGSRLLPTPAVVATGILRVGDRVAWRISAMMNLDLLATTTIW